MAEIHPFKLARKSARRRSNQVEAFKVRRRRRRARSRRHSENRSENRSTRPFNFNRMDR